MSLVVSEAGTPSDSRDPRVRRSPLGAIGQLGGMVALFGRAVRRGTQRPITWGPEFIEQFRSVVKVCLLPLLLVSFALSFGPAGVQGSEFFGLIGGFDRMGAAWQIVVTRVFTPMTTAIVLAGAGGTAICADLGARVVREEIDALHVLGVDTIKNIVFPRLLALSACALLFNALAMVAGMLGAILVLLQNHQPIAPFLHVFFANAATVELSSAFIKVAIYGAVIAVVCCYKGMTVSGGAEGVGRAVNQALVICFMSIAMIEYFFSQFVLATTPILSLPRG